MVESSVFETARRNEWLRKKATQRRSRDQELARIEESIDFLDKQRRKNSARMSVKALQRLDERIENLVRNRDGIVRRLGEQNGS